MALKRKPVIWLLPITLALMIPILYSLGLVTISTVVVSIDANGVAYGTVSGEALGSLNEVQLPTYPIPASVEVYVNDTIVPAIVVNNTVYIPTRGASSFTIKYICNTTLSNGISRLDFISNETITLVIAPNIVLLSMPDKVLNTYYLDNNLAFVFKGPVTIEYTVKEPVDSTNEGSNISEPSYLDISYIVLAAIVIILIGFGVYKYRKSRRLKFVEYDLRELDEVDHAIIKMLKSHNNEAFQSDLQRMLRLPKTTLWRHIKRLERLGYVEIVKENRRNKVILKKTPP